MKNMIVAKNVKYFHDDFWSDKEIIIPKMPFDNIFGDYRLFNGLPLEVADSFIGRFREIMMDLAQAHEDYKDYWKKVTGHKD